MLVRSLLALVSGLALVAAFEPYHQGWLIPVAIAGLVIATDDSSARRSAVAGWIFGLVFCFGLMHWQSAVDPIALVGMCVGLSLWFPLAAALASRARGVWSPMWWALVWTAVETVRSSWPFSGMPWGRLGFAVIDTPWQWLLPWLGVTGTSLLLALLGAALGAAMTRLLAHRRHDVFRPWTPAALALGVGALSLLPTVLPTPSRAAEHGSTTRVAVVQGGVPGSGVDLVAHHREVTASHARLTEAISTDPDLVIWPENSTAVDPEADAEVRRDIQGAVRAVGVPVLLAGMTDVAGRPDAVRNQGIVWDPQTGPGERYTKRHPVAFGEYIPFRQYLNMGWSRLSEVPRDMLAGDRRTPLEVAGVRVADAICFDVAYDDVLSDQVGRGGELAVVQTSNAMYVHTPQLDQQFAISRVRAVELGRTLVVASVNGISGVIEPDGTVTRRLPRKDPGTLTHDVALNSSRTPAVTLGPWVGRAAVLSVLAGMVACGVTYIRKKASPDVPVRSTKEAQP